MDVRLSSECRPVSEELNKEEREPSLQRLGRFDLVRPIGRGGMGVVYEALDRRCDNTVALKMLVDVTPSQIHRLKNEFRSLADLVHPNLVSFDGLFAEDGEWFLTMELVDGVDFLEYVRLEPVPELPRDTIVERRANRASEADATITRRNEKPKSRTAWRCSIARLRSAIVQLAIGIEAIHRAGKLHRDLKPSNVRVTPEGRLVILDFGLVSALETAERPGTCAGTIPYMSPEQAAGQGLTCASDWYSFGVMLFEALTGRRPFDGSRTAVLVDKQLHPAPSVLALAPDAPRDLAELADDLLATRPDLRPKGEEILARLGARAPSICVGSIDASFVGRSAELNRLHRAFAALDHEGSAILVHGPSGMGKTALIQRFLDWAERRGALVLRGRCYERESLPFKALDGVIDALSIHLSSLAPEVQQSLLSRRVRTLARLFPVLLEVPAIRATPHDASDPADPRELRRVAFSAFVAMLRRLADRYRLIVAIDDLQWGDADSGDLLAELVEDLPPLMLIGSFQTDDRSASELLSRLAGRCAGAIEEIELGPLTRNEARSLALSLMRNGAIEHADRIAEESAGIPIFVRELVRHGETPPPPLDDAINRRIGKLDPDAARMLDLVSIAGRPIEEELCQLATGLRGTEARAALNVLRAANLIRLRAGASATSVETYHDLIRRSVVKRMSAERAKEAHRRLARALEDLGASSDLLVHHWCGAGDPERAGEHALSAAKKASDALAFERAAELYRLAIALLEPFAYDLAQLHAELGEACANAGRAQEGACALLEAVKRGAPDAASLRSRAVHLLLTSGHVEPGLEELDRMLSDLGLRPIAGRRGMLRLAMQRARLTLSGCRLVRSARRPSVRELERIDACWSATTGLALIDMVLAADFHCENLRRAARSGDRYRHARALGMEAVLLGLRGGSSVHRAERVMADADTMIAELDHAQLRGLLAAARGLIAMSSSRWFEMLAEGERSEQILSQCIDASWGLDISRTLQLWSLCSIGRYDELESRASSLLPEAEARGDRYLSCMLRASPQVSLVWLAKDDPAIAEAQIEEEKRRWPKGCFTLQHYWCGKTMSQIELYRGDPLSAWEHHERTWRVLVKAAFLRVAYLNVHARNMRARAALAAGAHAQRSDLIEIALSEARRLSRDHTRWPVALAERIFGIVACWSADREEAVSRLVRSEALFAGLGMDVEVAATRRIRGLAIGGREGASLVDEADARLARAGVRDCARFTAALTGFIE